jgi:hypothetical protein
MSWPAHLIDRARRAPDPDLPVVAGTTPVIAFGDPTEARIATIGINPSSSEFCDSSGSLLRGAQRRLATLESLGVVRYDQITHDHANAIVAECASYFDRRPYHWFEPLNEVLKHALDASYADRTACHLDLVQWATSPIWGALAADDQAELLRTDIPFLMKQLVETPFELVLVNGRSVMASVERAGVLRWHHVQTLDGTPPAQFFAGHAGSTRLLAWTCNLQSQHGALSHLDDLARLVYEHGRSNRPSGAVGRAPRTSSASPPDHRHEARDDKPHAGVMALNLHFNNKPELVGYLSAWLERSSRDTIGDVGTYGGSAWATIDCEAGVIALNRDTTREAVESFVDSARRGLSYDWLIVTNQKGRVNKVLFCEDRTPGWFAYLREPLDAERRLGSGIPVAHVSAPPPPISAPASSIGDPRPAVAAAPPAGPRPSARAGTAAIVQFPHPGGEHVPTSSHMGWNLGGHARKFMTATGTRIDSGGLPVDGPFALWGEWEPPSRITRRWERHPGLPTVLHQPYWTRSGPGGERQNTDPWVFGETFLYSNCKQLNPNDSPSALQRLPVGSMILFGSGRGGEFVLDTVFVVGERAGEYWPMGPAGDLALEVDDAFMTCTIESLARLPSRYSHSTFTLFRGATPETPVSGMYSFAPCLPLDSGSPRFARPAVRLDGLINPLSTQSPSGATVLHDGIVVQRAWRSIVEQVRAARLHLAVHVDTPPEER